mmetsp:Transcript_42092/g.84511  ORF Transcript_42092/g.84511 Transcript_42092/m.84511 type:complete len:126 (-) Transcript_42092:12-389(-)
MEKAVASLPPRRGLHMRYFAIYDVGCLFLVVLPWMTLHFFSDHHAWMVWDDAFYLSVCYSLLMFPFIALVIPLVNTMLTDATPTGFDKSGMLGAVLNPQQIARMRELNQETKAMADGKGGIMGLI